MLSAGADIHNGARHALHTSQQALEPQSTSPLRTDIRAYGLALVTTMAGVAVTRFTWPLFSGTPFVPLFAAVAVTTHWGTSRAGLFAILLEIVVAPLAFPAGAPSPWEPRTLIMFVMTALLADRLVAARKRAESALRSSEAQLRATWEHAPLGTVLLNRSGYIERINPAFERLLGYSRSACAGMSYSEIQRSGRRRRRTSTVRGAHQRQRSVLPA